MKTNPDVMILDTDHSRRQSLRRILSEGHRALAIEEVGDVKGAREAILSRRPALVLLHSAFPYLEEDGTGLLELIQDDFRNSNIGVMLVLPISGSLLYRSGYQEGMEMLDMADDLITTDFTAGMIQAVVCEHLDRRTARVSAAQTVPLAETGLAPARSSD